MHRRGVAQEVREGALDAGTCPEADEPFAEGLVLESVAMDGLEEWGIGSGRTVCCGGIAEKGVARQDAGGVSPTVTWRDFLPLPEVMKRRPLRVFTSATRRWIRSPARKPPSRSRSSIARSREPSVEVISQASTSAWISS